MMSDRVVTVSPSYREEICTPMGGWGLVASPRYQPPPPDAPMRGPPPPTCGGGLVIGVQIFSGLVIGGQMSALG